MIYNVVDRLVKEIERNKDIFPGNTVMEWDGLDFNNEKVPDGLYIVSVYIMDGKKRIVKHKPIIVMRR